MQHLSENAPARNVPCERYISFPEHAVVVPSSSSSADVRPISNPSSPTRAVAQPVRCPSPVVAFESQSNGANDEQYILLEECFSGQASQKVSTSPTMPASNTGKLPVQSQSVDSSSSSHSVHSTANVNHKFDRDGFPQAAEYFNLSGKWCMDF
jgi:hypothetical protein